MNNPIWAICDGVAKAQTLRGEHAHDRLSDPGLVAIKLSTLFSETELLRAMHEVGYFPRSNTPMSDE
jgi:hypothetical protein